MKFASTDLYIRLHYLKYVAVNCLTISVIKYSVRLDSKHENVLSLKLPSFHLSAFLCFFKILSVIKL